MTKRELKRMMKRDYEALLRKYRQYLKTFERASNLSKLPEDSK